VDFVRTDLLAGLLASEETRGDESGRFDLIVSNPPYVGLADAPTLPREVREHEPHAALFAGRTGVEIYGRLIEQAKRALKERGILTVELGYNTADHALKIVREQTGWANVSITKDLAGIPRVLAAERLT
jgi:release factor glutamine methyltransferase